MIKTRGREVQMVTTITENEVTYLVVDGDGSYGDRGDARVVHREIVHFGQDRRHRAGGYEFVQAARRQHEAAEKLATARKQQHLVDYFGLYELAEYTGEQKE